MILAIDLGSTSFKAGVYNDQLACIGSGSCKLKYRHGSGGEVELATDEVTTAVRQAVTQALVGLDTAKLRAVSLTSQAQTFTLDKGSGNPVMPFISWLDRRAGAACTTLQQDDRLGEVAEHASFPVLSPALQLCQLRHLRDMRPEWWSADMRIVPLPSFILWQLTGQYACDDNWAAMSGLYSMKEGAWWAAALAACGLQATKLPQIVEAGRVAAVTTEAADFFGLPEGLPVILAGNDQTAGAYGAELHRNQALLITLGTCQVVYAVAPVAPSPHRLTAAGPYPGGGWYSLAAGQCGGMQINWAKTVLADCATDAAFDAAAATAPPGCNGLTFELGKREQDAAWHHIALTHQPGDFARSVLEALVADMVRLVGLVAGKSVPETLLVAGGGSRSAIWTRLISEMLARPLIPTEANPLKGAAAMARDVGQ